jgi:C-terminal processing protease CtpA/Prc
VWVLGLIRGSAAEQAGVSQGDQLLELDGRRLAGRSPFEVASLLQGQEEEERQGLGLQGTPVQVKASALPCVAVSWPAISPSSKA